MQTMILPGTYRTLLNGYYFWWSQQWREIRALSLLQHALLFTILFRYGWGVNGPLPMQTADEIVNFTQAVVAVNSITAQVCNVTVGLLQAFTRVRSGCFACLILSYLCNSSLALLIGWCDSSSLYRQLHPIFSFSICSKHSFCGDHTNTLTDRQHLLTATIIHVAIFVACVVACKCTITITYISMSGLRCRIMFTIH